MFLSLRRGRTERGRVLVARVLGSGQVVFLFIVLFFNRFGLVWVNRFLFYKIKTKLNPVFFQIF